MIDCNGVNSYAFYSSLILNWREDKHKNGRLKKREGPPKLLSLAKGLAKR